MALVAFYSSRSIHSFRVPNGPGMMATLLERGRKNGKNEWKTPLAERAPVETFPDCEQSATCDAQPAHDAYNLDRNLVF